MWNARRIVDALITATLVALLVIVVARLVAG